MNDKTWMQQAIDLARRGEGRVEPNPMVGCVLIKDHRCIGRGWHAVHGGPHAEVNAISNASEPTEGCTAYVTLEPCAHTGKTGPCVEALINAKVARVVVAVTDPNPEVAGKGIRRLREAGIAVDVGVLESESRDVLAPYLKLVEKGKPWIIGKWAMTVDGKMATASGDSEWISNADSRRIVHQIRSRVDGIMVGSGTARADNPKLTVRLSGLESHQMVQYPRVPLRIVFDSAAATAVVSNLVQTASEIPTLIAVGPNHDAKQAQRFVDHGVDVWIGDAHGHHERLLELLIHLGDRGVTNLLVEGGGMLLGLLHDLGEIDEVHAFIAPKLLGGFGSVTPVKGLDRSRIVDAKQMVLRSAERIGEDVYVVMR